MTDLSKIANGSEPIPEGLPENDPVILYNMLTGTKNRTEFLHGLVPTELLTRIAELLRIYPEAEQISKEWQKGRRK